MSKTGTIYGINGPVIYLAGNTGFKMSEMVYVGKEKLVGEVISLDKDRTTIQVYEETSGLKPGEIVEASGEAVSVTLAPGILDNIFDGIERPLERIALYFTKFGKSLCEFTIPSPFSHLFPDICLFPLLNLFIVN